MNLEAAVLANTAAVEALTAAVLTSIESRAAAVETLAGSAPAAAPAAARRGRPAKPVETPAAAPSVADAAPTPDEFRTAMGKFMDTKDEAVRKARREFVKSVLDHFGAKLLMEIPAENFAKVLGWSAEVLAGKTPNFSEGEDDQLGAEEEDPDDLMG